jgi:hypothetical protein
VYIDGVRTGESPLYRQVVAAGTHAIKIYYPDHGTYSSEKRIALRPGEARAIGFQP